MKTDKIILNAIGELGDALTERLENITSYLNISPEKDKKHKILLSLVENEEVLGGEEKSRQFPVYANINEYWKAFAKKQKNNNIDLISLALYEFIKKYDPDTFKEVDLKG